MYRFILLLCFFSVPVYAQSVIPNFQQGVLTQRSETKSTTVETPNFSDNVTSIAGGTAGNLAGTITSAGAITLTAGGHNTEALGQVTSTLIVD